MGPIDSFRLSGILDTCNLRIDDGATAFNKSLLRNAEQRIDVETGYEKALVGKFRNFDIKVCGFDVYINGSLAKYYFGNNVTLLDRDEANDALAMLSAELSLDTSNAVITRLDMAGTIVVPHPVKSYFHYFVDKPRHKKVPVGGTSLYWSTYTRTSALYDKGEEHLRHNPPLPKDLDHLMRFEARHLRGIQHRLVAKHFGLPKLTVQHLLKDEVFNFFIRRWHMEYSMIHKVAPGGFGLTDLIKPREFMETLASAGVAYYGGEERVMQIIEAMKVKHPGQYPELFSRLKGRIRGLPHSTALKKCQTIEDLDSSFNRYMEKSLIQS